MGGAVDGRTLMVDLSYVLCWMEEAGGMEVGVGGGSMAIWRKWREELPRVTCGTTNHSCAFNFNAMNSYLMFCKWQ